MSNTCHCENCGCDSEKNPEDMPPKEPFSAEATAGKKVEKLKKSIADLGFKVEETEDGIKITE